MKPNSHEPVSLPLYEGSVWARLLERLTSPTPCRVAYEPPLRWIVDATAAFALCIGGILVAGIIGDAIQFLGPMAYPTALLIGLFPVGLWIHYCGVGRGTTSSNVKMVIGLMALYAVQGGLNAIAMLPISLGILTFVLTTEWILGKFVLGWLPGSSVQPRRTEP